MQYPFKVVFSAVLVEVLIAQTRLYKNKKEKQLVWIYGNQKVVPYKKSCFVNYWKDTTIIIKALIRKVDNLSRQSLNF